MKKLSPQVAGVGHGLVRGLAELAGAPGLKRIWGEATAYSAPFYAHILATPGIQDHLLISGETLGHCQRQFRDRLFGRLD